MMQGLPESGKANVVLKNPRIPSGFFVYRNRRQYHAYQSPNYEIKDKILTEAIERSMVTL